MTHADPRPFGYRRAAPEGLVLGAAGGRQPLAAAIVAALLASLAIGVLIAVAGPLPALAALVGSVALVVTVRAPGVMLAAYLLIPFYKGAIEPYSPVDITVLLAAANAVQLLAIVGDTRPRTIANFGVALWVGLGLLVLAGTLYAPDQSLALGKAVSYWALVALPLLPATIRVGGEPRYVQQLLLSFLVMGIVTAIIGATQISAADRLVVLGMNTIQVGRAALLLPLVGVAYVIPRQRPGPTLAVIALIPAALLVAVASGSRGPLLMFAIIALAGTLRFFGTPRAPRGRALLVGVAIVLVVAAALALAAPFLPVLSLDRFTSLLGFLEGTSPSAGGGDTSAAARVVLFDFAWNLWTVHPILGAGTGGFEVFSALALGPAADTYPHNAVLQIASEYGLVGLGLATLLTVAVVRRPLPGRLTATTLRVLTAFFLLNAMVSGDIFTDRVTLGLLLLVLVIEMPRSAATSSQTAAREPGTTDGGATADPLGRFEPEWI